MSLNIYLKGPAAHSDCVCQGCGHTHVRTVRETYFSANITHNLNRMAMAVGIYSPLWRPDEVGVKKASQLIEPLEEGLRLLESDAARFKKFDSPLGYGVYDDFVPWLRSYLSACREHPDADVFAER